MTMYALTITAPDDIITDVQVGTLALVSYAAKEAAPVLEDNAEYRVTLLELPAEAGDPPRTLINMTADGESVNGVIKVRLTKLRKDAKANAPAPAQPASPVENESGWRPADADRI